MKAYQDGKIYCVIGLAVLGLSVSACGGESGPPQPPPPAPPEYADKHMPPDYWNNPEIIEEGKAIFTGVQNIDVNCASCHGKDGKPVKAGARDFRNTEHMKLYSDSQWFWRVNEGVTGTKMKAWKSKLSEDAIWKVIAFEATFGLDGKKYDPVKKAWVPADAPMTPAGGAAEPAEAPAEEPSEPEAEPKAE